MLRIRSKKMAASYLVHCVCVLFSGQGHWLNVRCYKYFLHYVLGESARVQKRPPLSTRFSIYFKMKFKNRRITPLPPQRDLSNELSHTQIGPAKVLEVYRDGLPLVTGKIHAIHFIGALTRAGVPLLRSNDM